MFILIVILVSDISFTRYVSCDSRLVRVIRVVTLFVTVVLCVAVRVRVSRLSVTFTMPRVVNLFSLLMTLFICLVLRCIVLLRVRIVRPFTLALSYLRFYMLGYYSFVGAETLPFFVAKIF